MALAGTAVYFAQPFSNKEIWSSRQAMISFTVLLLPGFGGVIGAVWSCIATRPTGAWEDVPVDSNLTRSKIDWENALEVVPIVDVLTDGGVNQKKRILLYSRDLSSKVNVPVTRLALADPDPEVRYYAAGLINRTETLYLAEITRLEKIVLENENDPQAWNSLADAYHAMVAEGISGDELGRFYKEKRLRTLERSLSINSHQPLTAVRRAETLLSLGRQREAVEAVRDLVHSTERDRALGVLLSAAYDQNDQSEIDRLASMIKDPEKLPIELRGLVDLYKELRERRVEDETTYADSALRGSHSNRRNRIDLSDQQLRRAREEAAAGYDN
ncbi:tetratricopeptide repeat protein [Effusibacillus consociatus]|uniref:Tetratricopeptide repeat protein n=1 Tax=Effusibacillus consociatus TaxID=1117041 RepID=A0ABV9PZV1_9BACL